MARASLIGFFIPDEGQPVPSSAELSSSPGRNFAGVIWFLLFLCGGRHGLFLLMANWIMTLFYRASKLIAKRMSKHL